MTIYCSGQLQNYTSGRIIYLYNKNLISDVGEDEVGARCFISVHVQQWRGFLPYRCDLSLKEESRVGKSQALKFTALTWCLFIISAIKKLRRWSLVRRPFGLAANQPIDGQGGSVSAALGLAVGEPGAPPRQIDASTRRKQDGWCSCEFKHPTEN